MQRAILLVLVVVVVAAAPAEPPRGRDRAPDVDVVVPIDPQPPPVWWMHPHDRRLVPPTVSIDEDAYVCDLDGQTFADRDTFIDHLRSVHSVAPERIPALLSEVDGQVHFLGDGAP